MELPIIKIGNSKGIRLSKKILEHYNIEGRVELVLEKDMIVLKPIHKPRMGWSEAFKSMGNEGDDRLLIDDVLMDEEWDQWD